MAVFESWPGPRFARCWMRAGDGGFTARRRPRGVATLPLRTVPREPSRRPRARRGGFGVRRRPQRRGRPRVARGCVGDGGITAHRRRRTVLNSSSRRSGSRSPRRSSTGWRTPTSRHHRRRCRRRRRRRRRHRRQTTGTRYLERGAPCMATTSGRCPILWPLQGDDAPCLGAGTSDFRRKQGDDVPSFWPVARGRRPMFRYGSPFRKTL